MAVITLGSAIAAAAMWPTEDPREIEHTHPEQDHEHAFGDTLHHASGLSQSEQQVRHRHGPLKHSHAFIIDDHHPVWPTRG